MSSTRSKAVRRSDVFDFLAGNCCCFLQALTTKEKIAHMKASMPANVAKAMGRLSSGLYIVTAQQENARRWAGRHTYMSVRGCVCV